MAVLTLQDASQGLADVQFAAAAAGDQVESGTRTGGWELGVVLLVRNANATLSRDVTVEGTQFTIPLSAQAIIPVRGGVAFGDLVDVTYSDVADLTVASVRLAGL